MHGDLANNINFHYGSNQEKFNVHIFKQIKKKNYFGLFYDISPLLGQKHFLKEIRLCHTQLCVGFLHNTKIKKKLMIRFQENV